MEFDWRFLLFFLVSLVILGLLYGYTGWRLIGPSRLSGLRRKLAWAGVWTFMVIPVFSMILLTRGAEGGLNAVLAWTGYVSMGFFSLLFFFVVVKDVLRLLFRGGAWLNTKANSHPSPSPAPADLGRRQFLTDTVNLGILGATAGLTGYGIFEATRKPAIKEVGIPLARLPKAFHGLRIAQFTDVHVGLTVKGDFVRQVTEQILDLQPDLIVFTGDLVDGSVAALRKDVEVLRELSAPLGTYFVTGNHEYYSGAEAWVEEADRLGFRVLMNEHVTLERAGQQLVLAGITDATGGDFLKSHTSDPHKALAGASPDACRILLAHQPASIFGAVEAGIDLQLSGHTHGGQFFPWHYLVKLDQPYVKGLYQHENAMIYVSQGTGYWGPPMRIGTRSEVTLVTLESAG